MAKDQMESRGIEVHWARNAEEANKIIYDLFDWLINVVKGIIDWLVGLFKW